MKTLKATGTRATLAFLSMVVMAGALALAACGGGSTTAASSSPSSTASASTAAPSTASGSVAPSELPTPAPTPTVAGTILFDSNNGDVSVVRTDGSGLRRVIKGPRQEGMPSWSPDGRLIAYDVLQDNGVWAPAAAKADGSDAGRLPLAKEGGGPSWSPDDKRLAYFVMPASPGAPSHIFVCDADGSHRRQLTEGPDFDFYPAWAPDGQTILFLRSKYNYFVAGDVYSVRPDGSGLTQVTSTGKVIEFALSPDGSQLAVDDFATRSIVLLPYGTSGPPKTILGTDFGWGIVNISWSPDGKALVLGIGDNVEGEGDVLVIVNADGSGLSAIPGVKGKQPEWRPE